jgi:hypothetical protein
MSDRPSDKLNVIHGSHVEFVDGSPVEVWDYQKKAPEIVESERVADINAISDRAKHTAKSTTEQRISAGITLDILGAPHRYPTSLTDQANLIAQALAATQGYDGKLWCQDADGKWARVLHSAKDVINVAFAVRQMISEEQDQYERILKLL